VFAKDQQYVEMSVAAESSPADLLDDAYVRWQSEDPDDPSDEEYEMTAEAGALVDPNDYDPVTLERIGSNGGDNTGRLESPPVYAWRQVFTTADEQFAVEDENTSFTAGTAREPAGSVTGSAETRIVNGKSRVFFHVTDHGGDNFVVKVSLKRPTSPSLIETDKTGVMTVWKRMEVEYRQMRPDLVLPVDQVQPSYDPAFVEWHFHDEGAAREYEFLEPLPGEISYCSQYVNDESVGQFHHRGDGGWVLAVAARNRDTEHSADPQLPPLPSGTGVVQDATRLMVDGGGLTPDTLIDDLVVIGSGGGGPTLTFAVSRNTADQITIVPIEFVHPEYQSGLGVRQTVDLIAIGGPVVHFQITRGAILGSTPHHDPNTALWNLPDANILIFLDTISRYGDEAAELALKSTVHELMHSFELHHDCGNRSYRGDESCNGTASGEVTTTEGIIRLAVGTRFCGEHLRAIRNSDGYGAEEAVLQP
jgi:hypothetical protein